MQITKFYFSSGPTTRKTVAAAYVRAIRHLQEVCPDALSRSSAPETSALIVWRIVTGSAQGIRDPDLLKALALRDFNRVGPLRGLARIRSHQLEQARITYERKMQCCLELRDDARRAGRDVPAGLINAALNEVCAAKDSYISLLEAWSDHTAR